MGETVAQEVDPATGQQNPWNAWNHLRVETTTPSAIISVGEGGDTSWTAALETGLIRPVDPRQGGEFTAAATRFYESQGNFALVPATLTGDVPVELGEETHESLVMQWDPLEDREIMPVAAWDLAVRDELQDLSNTSLHFSLGVPERFENGEPTGESAIWDVSVELVDIQGNSRGWFLQNPPIGWHEYWIMVDQGDQDGFQFVESGPFDVTQVTQNPSG